MEKLRVLVVDDKKVVGDFFEFVFTQKGHEVRIATNYTDAIEAVRHEQFDLAFLDVVMPNIDGIATLVEIKAISPTLPVIIMSGYSVEEKFGEAKELGAASFLAKPIELRDVEVAVREAVGKEL